MLLRSSPAVEAAPLSRDCFREATPERRARAASASGGARDTLPSWLFLRGLLKDTVRCCFLLLPCKHTLAQAIPALCPSRFAPTTFRAGLGASNSPIK